MTDHAARRAARPGGAVALDVTADPITATRMRLAAVLLHTPRHGEVWVALDAGTAAELVAEEEQREHPRPVLLPEQVVRLRGLSERAVRGVLEVSRVWPGARLV